MSLVFYLFDKFLNEFPSREALCISGSLKGYFQHPLNSDLGELDGRKTESKIG